MRICRPWVCHSMRWSRWILGSGVGRFRKAARVLSQEYIGLKSIDFPFNYTILKNLEAVRECWKNWVDILMCLASIQPCHVLTMSADLVCAQHTKLFIALAEPRPALKETSKVRTCTKNQRWLSGMLHAWWRRVCVNAYVLESLNALV